MKDKGKFEKYEQFLQNSQTLLDRMTERQAAFCREYVANGGNGKDAALAAGYSKKRAQQYGSELLFEPKIKEFIALLNERKSQRSMVTGEYVIDSLDIIKNMALGLTEVEEDIIIRHKGDVITKRVKVKKVDYNAATRALELMGKSLALFIDKQQVEAVKDTETIEDYLKRIEQDTKALAQRKDDVEVDLVEFDELKEESHKMDKKI